MMITLYDCLFECLRRYNPQNSHIHYTRKLLRAVFSGIHLKKPHYSREA